MCSPSAPKIPKTKPVPPPPPISPDLYLPRQLAPAASAPAAARRLRGLGIASVRRDLTLPTSY